MLENSDAARAATPSLTEQVYAQLKDQILRSELRPGSVVLEGDLADQFGVSKTPIREALRLLVQDGWIDVMPRRGYLIRPIGLVDLREVYELRVIIEMSAGAAAAAKPSDELIERLTAAIDAQAHAGDSIERSIDASREFHLALASQIDNARLVKVLEGLLDEVERLLRMLPQLVSVMTSDDELEAHREIVSAIRAGDVESTRSHIESHLGDISRTLLDAIGGIG
jgi:DNA-binding GntR family transcriptional regulator